MLKIILFLLCLTTPLSAQILNQDQGVTEQLVPESFKFDGTAQAAKFGLFDWKTTISYSLTNNSGMNLYMGILMGSVGIGSCSEARSVRGGLQLLPGPNSTAYAIDLSVGPPRPLYVSAGQKISGTIIVEECEAPNPGVATAPVALTLMLGKTQSTKVMTQISLSAEMPVRQIQAQ